MHPAVKDGGSAGTRTPGGRGMLRAVSVSVFFDTPVYAAFLTLVVLVYWRLSWRRQNLFLLGASYLFYGWWDARFLILIFVSTTVDFFCAHAIAASSHPGRRRALLTVSLAMNFAFLGVFKYFDFFVDSLAVALDALGLHVSTPVLRILLPPGISFYTFQEVAYIVDVYYRKLEPADSFVDYALFISLFPHLIAGPIQRPRRHCTSMTWPAVALSSCAARLATGAAIAVGIIAPTAIAAAVVRAAAVLNIVAFVMVI
jgi:D-alanyl-lipoteichoic acid acyltransferase DltB (MBOAT superfamily)